MSKKLIEGVMRAGQAKLGNVVRRSRRNVMRYSTPEELEREVRQLGFHLARIGDQFVIICNKAGAISAIC